MNLFQKELHVFFNGLVFFTRIPAPKWVAHSHELLNLSVKYLPLFGLLIGIITAAVYYASSLIFPNSIAILLSLTASILITGAFHEDGFADCCDGFGGGWNQHEILAIMKDSRLGTYGTIGLILILSLKYLTLINAIEPLIFLLLSGHSLSRFMPLLLIYHYDYVRDTDTSKAKPTAQTISLSQLFIALLSALLPLLIFERYEMLLALLPMLLCTLLLGQYFKKHINGYTGDCLGAVQQVSEVVYYLFSLVLWNYI